MTMHKRRFLSSMAAGAMSAAGLGIEYAQAQAVFPAKPVQLVIPFAPGDTDAMLRPMSERVGEFLGQPMVLNYKPGAGGAVGAGLVAAASADGYTLVGSTPGSLVVVPLANKDVKYSTDSFVPVAAVSEGGLMLVVPASAPYRTLREMVEAAKKNPGQITFSTSGAMGITHLLTEIFAREAGIKLNHIPYPGSGPAITALLGGHVAMSATAVAPSQAHLKAGTVRALAVFGSSRLKAFPDIPTVRESGFNFGSPTLYGICAPKGTPREVIDALWSAIRKTADKHAEPITAALATLGAEMRLLGPAEYAGYLREQQSLFAAGIKTLG